MTVPEDDGSLVQRASGGDIAAGERLVGRYQKKLFGLVLSYALFSREQAFQIVVASFVKVLRGGARTPADSDLFGTLLKICLAECRGMTPAGASFSTTEPIRIVRDALLGLSDADRTILLLRDQVHLPMASIASLLGSSVSSTRSSCLEARERLRDAVRGLLEKTGGGQR